MKIGELARRTGVPADTLRAWERRYGLLRPRRTAGNQRLYSSLDEQRIHIMRGHLARGTPAALAAELTGAVRMGVAVGGGQAVAPAEVRAAHLELRDALDDFDETGGQRVLERLFAAHARLAVLRDVLLPYMADVGRRWADGHLTVAQEHFASAFLEVRLMAVARGWDRGVGPRALLACAPGERHTFGLVCFGIALHQYGWRITCLGADTPLDMVRSAAERIAPDLVVISAAIHGRLTDDADLRALTASWRCALGGAGAIEGLAERVGAEYLVAIRCRRPRACGTCPRWRRSRSRGSRPGQDLDTDAPNAPIHVRVVATLVGSPGVDR